MILDADGSPIAAAMSGPSDRHNNERICVVYFENREGYVIVAPDQRHPTPEGFIRKEAKTLREIDKLTARMNRQDTDMFSRMWEKDRQQMLAQHERHRTALRQRLLAADCTRAERLFILSAFRYFDKKEEEYKNFKVQGYFSQREFDSVRGDIDHATRGKQLTMPKLSDRLANILTS